MSWFEKYMAYQPMKTTATTTSWSEGDEAMSEYIVDVGNAAEEYVEQFGHMATTYADNPIREQIVRCRDCKRWIDDCEWNRFFDDPEIDEPNGFCAWGERKDEND